MKPKERLDKRTGAMNQYGTSPYDLDRIAGHVVNQDDKLNAVMTPAETIVKRFGGVYHLRNALNSVLPEGSKKIHASTIYRWMLPKSEGGRGGHIPAQKIDLIIKAARYNGILVVQEDFIPKAFYRVSLKDD